MMIAGIASILGIVAAKLTAFFRPSSLIPVVVILVLGMVGIGLVLAKDPALSATAYLQAFMADTAGSIPFYYMVQLITGVFIAVMLQRLRFAEFLSSCAAGAGRGVYFRCVFECACVVLLLPGVPFVVAPLARRQLAEHRSVPVALAFWVALLWSPFGGLWALPQGWLNPAEALFAQFAWFRYGFLAAGVTVYAIVAYLVRWQVGQLDVMIFPQGAVSAGGRLCCGIAAVALLVVQCGWECWIQWVHPYALDLAIVAMLGVMLWLGQVRRGALAGFRGFLQEWSFGAVRQPILWLLAGALTAGAAKSSGGLQLAGMFGDKLLLLAAEHPGDALVLRIALCGVTSAMILSPLFFPTQFPQFFAVITLVFAGSQGLYHRFGHPALYEMRLFATAYLVCSACGALCYLGHAKPLFRMKLMTAALVLFAPLAAWWCVVGDATVAPHWEAVWFVPVYLLVQSWMLKAIWGKLDEAKIHFQTTVMAVAAGWSVLSFDGSLPWPVRLIFGCIIGAVLALDVRFGKARFLKIRD